MIRLRRTECQFMDVARAPPIFLFGFATKQFPRQHPPGEITHLFVSSFFQLISHKG